MLAYRLLLSNGAYGGWDVDSFLREIPASKWEELKIAHYLIAHQDAWPYSEEWGKPPKKPWKPPSFESKKKGVRRRMNGETY